MIYITNQSKESVFTSKLRYYVTQLCHKLDESENWDTMSHSCATNWMRVRTEILCHTAVPQIGWELRIEILCYTAVPQIGWEWELRYYVTQLCHKLDESENWDTMSHSCATNWMRVRTEILCYTAVPQIGWKRKPLLVLWVNFHPQRMPKKSAMWNVWLKFHPQCIQWKSYYDKVMGEFSSPVYTVKVLLCSDHWWFFPPYPLRT